VVVGFGESVVPIFGVSDQVLHLRGVGAGGHVRTAYNAAESRPKATGSK
jgi:hypothetical protein